MHACTASISVPSPPSTSSCMFPPFPPTDEAVRSFTPCIYFSSSCCTLALGRESRRPVLAHREPLPAPLPGHRDRCATRNTRGARQIALAVDRQTWLQQTADAACVAAVVHAGVEWMAGRRHGALALQPRGKRGIDQRAVEAAVSTAGPTVRGTGRMVPQKYTAHGRRRCSNRGYYRPSRGGTIQTQGQHGETTEVGPADKKQDET
jgi:hypothetical protein